MLQTCTVVNAILLAEQSGMKTFPPVRRTQQPVGFMVWWQPAFHCQGIKVSTLLSMLVPSELAKIRSQRCICG